MKKLPYILAGALVLASLLLWHILAVRATGTNTLLAVNNTKLVINNAKVYIGQAPALVPTPIPTPAPPWAIESVDVMKYSKDDICSQLSTSTIQTQLSAIVALNANYVAVSGYYNPPSDFVAGCGTPVNDSAYMSKWANLARADGLKVWWRMKDLSWEGDYNTAKASSTGQSIHLALMNQWETASSSMVQSGDIFTPYAEPENGGINGITYCGNPAVCQMTNDADFNTFIQTIQTESIANLPAGVKVGYDGFTGFIVAGLGNGFWQPQCAMGPPHCFLTAATIAMLGEIDFDDYPETRNSTYAVALPIIQTALGSSTIPLIVGEYGTITAGNETTQLNQINTELPDAIAYPNVKGFNYWNLGPAGGESLVHSNYTPTLGYPALASYYHGP